MSRVNGPFMRGLCHAGLYLLAAMAVCALTAACATEGGGGGGGGATAGCQVVPAGQARASRISAASGLISGPSAESRMGDYKLQNARVAVVIKDTASSTAFLPFGGYPVDAVPTDDQGCPLPEDNFGEMGTLIGNLDLVDFYNTSLRGFDPDAIQIVNNGADGGDAVIRVRGTDIPIPIIETGLLLLVPDKGFSSPMNLDIQTDYILAPDSNVLQMKTTVVNPLNADSVTIAGADGFLFGDGMTTNYPSAGHLLAAGYELFSDIKFLTSSDGRITYGYGLDDNHFMVSITVQNVTPVLDQNLMAAPVHLLPGGTTSFSRRLVIMTGDANAMAQQFYPLWGASVEPFYGMVVTENTGEPVPDAVVEIHADDGNLTYVTDFTTDEDGFFAGELEDAPTYTVVVRATARPTLTVGISEPYNYGHTFVMGAPGSVAWDVRDTDGNLIPAKLTLFQGATIADWIFTPYGTGSQPMLPGTYDVSVSRGPEYTVSWWHDLVVPAGGEATVRATLDRVVDTTGFVAADFHFHAAPSPDCDMPLTTRVSTLLAEGVEFISSTDHEVITNYRPVIKAMGVADKISAVFGEEISNPILGHFNAYSMNWDPSMRANGAIDWFLFSPQQIFALARQRGATIVQMNHPRDEEDGYLTAMLFNRSTGLNDEHDPMMLGLLPGATILSLDFNAMEILNGGSKDQIFYDAAHPDTTGALRDWFTLLNMGHRITGVGNSDSHRFSRPPGYGRNLIESSTDDPAKINPQELLDNLAAQRSVVSGGAFIRFTVDNTGLGRTVTDTDGTVDLAIQVQSPDWVDVTKVVIFSNCSVVQTIDVTDQTPVVKYQGTLTAPVTQDAWFVVMAVGDNTLYPVAPEIDYQAPRAVTNPIYVDYDGNGVFNEPGIIACASPY